MNKNFLSIAAISGCISVALGAFAAHKLKDILSADALNVFQTAVRYQFYHTFALLIVAILYEKFPNKLMKWAGNCFIIGIILFSGSLYGLTILRVNDIAGFDKIGIITPFGGTFFIVGWLLIFLGVTKKQV
ncbi:MAG TPA: DUF423 domain-containing protein [Puia sp.]|jgi:uncharacterized membrane protein YgdD (TMEM256/DUF423 family)|nr:DUF423 domain-containing protein [Puia sp.]